MRISSAVLLGFLVGAVSSYGLIALHYDGVRSTETRQANPGLGKATATVSGVKPAKALGNENQSGDFLREGQEQTTDPAAAQQAEITTAEMLSSLDSFDREWAELTNAARTEDDRQRLISAGFTPARADRLLQREAELRMSVLEAGDGQQDDAIDELRLAVTARQMLRAEIGDGEYERYLQATNQSTSVSVQHVLEGSSAESAGLRVGDEIVDYAGARVFNMIDLSERARQRPRGEAVVVNVLRAGMPLQFVLHGGPLGIAGGRLPTR